MIHPEYTTKRLFNEMMGLSVTTVVTEGYTGTVARTTTLSPGVLVGNKRWGAVMVGTIPDSMKTASDQWMDDIIAYNDHTMFQSLIEVRLLYTSTPN